MSNVEEWTGEDVGHWTLDIGLNVDDLTHAFDQPLDLCR